MENTGFNAGGDSKRVNARIPLTLALSPTGREGGETLTPIESHPSALLKRIFTFSLWMLVIIGCVLTGPTGCASKATTRAKIHEAYLAGRRDAQREMQSPVVTINGDVRKPFVPWTKDLTLAQALIQSEYRGTRDPKSITIIRKDETFKINTQQFLKGEEDVPLEAGDVIELER